LRYRPRREALEDRALPSTFTVLNTNDTGAGSLRQALLDANAGSGANKIVFNIGSGGAQTISDNLFNQPLPALGSSITLDGTTQPGFAGTPIIVLSGLFSGVGSPGPGLTITGNNSAVIGLDLLTAGCVMAPGAGSRADGTVAIRKSTVSPFGCPGPGHRPLRAGAAGADVCFRDAQHLAKDYVLAPLR
jgi:hypothetical protein